ncbi:MAG: hypothetical protein WC314_05110 [Vulcanimicrobiota bacterium]
MIETISSEHGRLLETAAAAANYVPRFQPLSQLKPEPTLIRGIGLSTDADAFRGASPDLQSLLDALLSNFGNDHDLVESDAKNLETNSRIRDNNEGSREAVESLRDTAHQGSETVQLENQVKDQRDKFRGQPLEADSAPLANTAEHRLGAAEADLSQAESLWTRAQSASERVPHSSPSDQEKLQKSAELFQQKAAAAESAARLHMVMVEKVRRMADQQRTQEQEQKRELEALKSFEGDSAFAERLRELKQLLNQ